jgi:two-component system sensor histidine kinase UhpB
MVVVLRFLSNLRLRFLRVPLLIRVLVGNSAVIILGAIGGTLITRHLAMIGDIKLILLFATLGIFVTLLLNFWIIKTALRPMEELRSVVDQVGVGQPAITKSLERYTEPDIHRLVVVINSMLTSLMKRTAQLRALSERAINAQEEERRRIARGLHDDTAQALSMLIIQLERLEAALLSDMPDLRIQCSNARQLATDTLEELRKIIWDLRPSILDDLGLLPAIRWYARSNLEKAGVGVKFEFSNENIRLDSSLETTLFRIAQEAVNNILNHADASKVTIRLRQINARACLEVEDDGRGFDVKQAAGQALSRKQLGLLGIEERASLVGGKIEVDSSPGRGTRVHVCVPLLDGSHVHVNEDNLETEGPAEELKMTETWKTEEGDSLV